MKNSPAPKGSLWTILKILEWTTQFFKDNSIEGPRASAEILLAHALGLNRLDLYLQYDQPLHGQELQYFKTFIKKRVAGEPVAYITGTKSFWSIDLNVNRDVLIPRPETECLVEEAIKILDEKTQCVKNVLELGTGSGAVIIALALEHQRHNYWASDISPAAIKVATANAAKYDLPSRIGFFCGRWFDPVKDSLSWDLIVSNPPYIKKEDIGLLQPEILKFEPNTALDGGADGLGALRCIIEQSHRYLSPNGRLILEMGFDQRDAVESITRECNQYGEIHFRQDYCGLDRIAIIKKTAVSKGL
ncbi:MAG: peptide chain release factor N(5)-glutamine methyltransferase [Desulfobacteraceae bacterium]|nr:peptide chain release factor N(5)-glutamine methyltransferase [Desulfobacteraceae bacterium]